MPMQRSRRSRSLKQLPTRRKSYMRTANKVVSALNTGVRFRNLAKGARNAYKRYQSSGSLVKAVLGSGTGGDYSQFTTAKMSTGTPRKTTLMGLTKEIRSRNEVSVFRFGGMNNFNDNGYFWCGKNRLTAANRTDLPMYMFDLTSVNNIGTGGSTFNAIPFQRATVASATGNITWNDISGLQADGTSVTSAWGNEKISSTATGIFRPHEKSRLLWSDVRLNLWGAKSKAIKWTVQLVKVMDDAIDPRKRAALDAGTDDDKKHNAVFQGLIKPYTYNPLALTSASRISRYIKVIKTYNTVIQPTSTNESDTDPHVKVLKWFMRWDRDLNYAQTSAYINSTANDLVEQADYSIQAAENSCYVKSTSKIFLLIRASAYAEQVDANVDNTVSPSFDMSIRVSHVTS